MIRRAVPEDAPALHALAAQTFPLACPPGSTAADQQAFIDAHLSEAAFAGAVADPDRILFVADAGAAGDAATTRLEGYTMVVVGEPLDADVRAVVPERPTAELSKCYVLPAAHGTGVAAALVAASVLAAAERGAVVLWLGVNAENARAQRFYARQGFRRVGTKRFQVGTRLEHDLVLARPLLP